MSQDRDTHFKQFAKLLWHEISSEVDTLSTEENGIVDGCVVCNWTEAKVAEVLVPIIARRAYDLVAHAMADLIEKHDGNIELLDVAGQGTAFAACAPDLTEWPKD